MNSCSDKDETAGGYKCQELTEALRELQMTPGLRTRRIRKDIEKEYKEPRDSLTPIAYHRKRGKNGPDNIHNKVLNRGHSVIQRLVRESDTEQQEDDIAKIDLNLYVLMEYELHATRRRT